VNEKREIILIDQRGTQYTDLPLICPDYATARVQAMLDNQFREEVVPLESQALVNCAQSAVDQGINIEVFNSLQNVADIKDLRDALGYDQINLYGVSYGSMLAQHIMREYPEMLRSVTLDGVFPLSIDFGTDMGKVKGQAYEDFVTACAADEACNQAYPDLGQRLAEFYDALEASPVPITLTDNATGQTVEAPMDGDLMATVLINSLYRTSYYDDLLAGLKAAGEGDFSFFARDVPRALTLDGLAVLMHFTTICAEDADFTMEDVGVEDAPPLLQGYVETNSAVYLTVCEALNLPRLDNVVDEAVESDLPVLALSGQLDPATPVAWLDQVLPGLSNAYSFINPAGAHGQLPFGRDDDCIADIFSSFLDDPATEPDADCLQEEQIQFLPAE
jgi:pimeloyl-ACP methyl ester carboxylesterase